MKKILFLSPFNNEISFNYVSRNIIKYFNKIYSKDFEIIIYSINSIDDYEGNIKKSIHSELNIKMDNIYTIEPLIKISDNNFDIQYVKYYMSGCKYLHNIILDRNPDYIFILCDLWLVKILINHINKIRDKWWGKILPYIPIDISNLDNKILDFNTDIIITASNYTKNEILKVKPYKNVEVLHHIISNNYFKLDNKEILKAREQYFGKENINKFIIGSFNANSIRKRWDILIDAFCKFFKSNNNSLLLIKTNILNYRQSSGHDQGFILEDLINYNLQKYNIKNNPIKVILDKLEETELNKLYNSIDIAINATDGEGFGMFPFELGRAEKITILPNHSTFNSFYEKYKFNFLIETHRFPASYIRDTDNLENLLVGNSFFCVYKNNISFDKHKIQFVKNKLYISNHINTIFVTNKSFDNFEINHNPIKNLTLFHHVNTLSKAFELIEKNNNLPDQFQILISSDLNIIEESYHTLQKYYYKLNNKELYRNIMIIDPIIFKNYTKKDGYNCFLVSSQGIYNKLMFYYNNKDILEKEGKEISKLIKKKLNSKKLTNDFFNLLK